MLENNHPQIAGGTLSCDPVVATDNASKPPVPEFIRLPRTGTREPITGLSRSGLNALILPCQANGFKPPVKSISLRKRGAARGTRLINFDSLRSYLQDQLQGMKIQ